MCTLRSTFLDLSKGTTKSHLANKLSRWQTRTKIFCKKMIKGDETWCFAYDPETKRQNSEWVGETSPLPNNLKFQKSRAKIMLIFLSILKA
jgi:hypothetical protein